MHTILSNVRQCALVSAVLLATLLAGGAEASVPVGLYPVQGQLSDKSRMDVRNLLAAGLQMAESRDVFTARKPLVVPVQCASPVTTECLSRLAGNGGTIIYATAREKKAAVEITLELVTWNGKRTKPIRFESGVFIQDDRLGGRAIEALEKSYLELNESPVELPTAEVAPAPVERPQVSVGSEPPVPSWELKVSAESAPSTWHTPAAIGCGVGGAAVFGGGAVFGLLARRLNDDLTDRYNKQTLVPEDHANYERLKTYNVLATTMMIGGGALAAAGLTFWALSPGVDVSSDGSRVWVGGRF